MSKVKRRRSVGQQHHKPFPVVNMRFRLLPQDEQQVCCVNPCQSLEYMSERPRALFVAQSCGDVRLMGNSSYTEQEQGELTWEKAYRDQMAGKEPDSLCCPICAQCMAYVIANFLNDDNERRAAQAIAAAVSTGKDIILFDRNLSRNRTDPALACGRFETLADFRRQYWQGQEK